MAYKDFSNFFNKSNKVTFKYGGKTFIAPSETPAKAVLLLSNLDSDTADTKVILDMLPLVLGVDNFKELVEVFNCGINTLQGIAEWVLEEQNKTLTTNNDTVNAKIPEGYTPAKSTNRKK